MALKCFLFPLITHQIFLQLNWSPPVVNPVNWTDVDTRVTR